jgi:hypothetical protein
MEKINTICQTTGYQPCTYRRQRNNANTVNVGDKHNMLNYRLSTLYVPVTKTKCQYCECRRQTQYATLQVINFLCIGNKQKMPLHRLRSDSGDILKTQVESTFLLKREL